MSNENMSNENMSNENMSDKKTYPTHKLLFWHGNAWNMFEEYGTDYLSEAQRIGAGLAQMFSAVQIVTSEDAIVDPVNRVLLSFGENVVLEKL